MILDTLGQPMRQATAGRADKRHCPNGQALRPTEARFAVPPGKLRYRGRMAGRWGRPHRSVAIRRHARKRVDSMRIGWIISLVGVFITATLGMLAAGVDFGAVAVVINGALIYGLTAALR
jgi:hypothetical protein